jgi:micrococcal nuclease
MMRCLLCVMLLALGSIVQAEEFDAKVIAVMDGDTVMVLRDGLKIKIRLVNIDAPESKQEFGRESRQALANRVLKKQVRVNSRAVDSYGRMVAELSVDGQSVNEEQVKNGMAWEYSHFHSNKFYLSLHNEALQARRGLWSHSKPVAPWEWRKQHPGPDYASSSRAVPHLVICGKKKRCVQMSSCAEALLYLTQCGVSTLDANANGIPCEDLCVKEAAQTPGTQTDKMHLMNR